MSKTSLRISTIAAIVVLVVLSGCERSSSLRTENLAEEYFSLAVPQDRWLEIIDSAGPKRGDIRDLQNCGYRSFQPPVEGPWEKRANQEMSELLPAQHQSFDHLFRVGDVPDLMARMAYKDQGLKGEWVRIFWGDCDGWRQIGTLKTDGNGWVEIRNPRRPAAGVYSVAFQVVGDGSFTRSEVWILPRETEVIPVDLAKEFYAAESPEGESLSSLIGTLQSHTSEGRAILYLAPLHRLGLGSAVLRQELIKQGLPSGPVIPAEQARSEPEDE